MKQNKHVKKKAAALTAAVVVTASAVGWGFPSLADETRTESLGALIMEGGEVAAYAEDIDYLQTEAKELIDELLLEGGSMEDNIVIPDDAARKKEIKSKGTMNYDDGKVVIAASDLLFLAQEMDELEYEYKIRTLKALNGVGTYFTAQGEITYDSWESGVSEEQAVNLSFKDLERGIQQSQSVDHLAGMGIQPVTASNLSKDTAAWVDGDLIIGNGEDNDSFYDDGYNKGYEKGFTQGQADASYSGIELLSDGSSETITTERDYAVVIIAGMGVDDADETQGNVYTGGIGDSIYTFANDNCDIDNITVKTEFSVYYMFDVTSGTELNYDCGDHGRGCIVGLY